MEQYIYDDMKKHQNSHWWFRARKRIIDTLLNEHLEKEKKQILDIGAGLGGNISFLEKYGDVSFLEKDVASAEYIKIKNPKVKYIDIDFPKEKLTKKFDLICMFDVLEHIDDDFKVFETVKDSLNEEGLFFITVPAYQFLYSTHDKNLHHIRRYNRKRLNSLIKKYRFKVIKYTNYNFFLFPFILLVRLFDLISSKKNSTGYDTPNKFLNRLFFGIFDLEKYLINKINFPFGASFLIILKKEA